MQGVARVGLRVFWGIACLCTGSLPVRKLQDPSSSPVRFRSKYGATLLKETTGGEFRIFRASIRLP